MVRSPNGHGSTAREGWWIGGAIDVAPAAVFDLRYRTQGRTRAILETCGLVGAAGCVENAGNMAFGDAWVTGESAILSWMLTLPAAGALAVWVLPEKQLRRPWIGARAVALVFGMATLLVAAMAAGLVDFASGGMQLVQRAGWTGSMPLRYAAGVDGISMPLVMLTAALGVLACWASYGIKQSVRSYFALQMVWLAVTLGALVALDALLFMTFLLAGIVALYFLMVAWGSDRKVLAARRYLYFSLAAVAVVLVALFSAGGADTAGLTTNTDESHAQLAWQFWAMLLAFGVLAAVLPVHWWLAEVLAEVSTPVAMLVAAVVQMLGGYGMLRICYPLFARQAAAHTWGVGLLGVLTMAYGVLAALGQKELRRMGAYVSVTLMGFFVLGLAMRTETSVMGAAYVLTGHAVALAMWVFVAGMVEDRVGHSEIARLGGLGGHMPAFAGWSAVAFLAVMGMPGLGVFVGELLVLLGTFARSDGMTEGAVLHEVVWLGAAGVAVMVLLMGCCLWTYQRVFLGTPRPEHSNLARMSLSERWILALLGLGSLASGVAPMLLTEPMRVAVGQWCRVLSP